MFRACSRRAFTLVELFVVIVVIALLIGLCVPAVMSAREAARRAACIGTFKMIGLALHNYHDANKSFPPSTLVRPGEQALSATAPQPGSHNANGASAGFSWRVLILPLMEDNNLYKTLDLDAGFPYDANTNHVSAANVPCAARFEYVPGSIMQRCPSFDGPYRAKAPEYVKKPSGLSNYVAIGATHLASLYGTETEPIGGRLHPNGTIYPGSQTTISNITDGTSNTLLTCESREQNYAAWIDGTTAAVVGLTEQSRPSFVLDAAKGYYLTTKGTLTSLNYGGNGKYYLAAADHSGSEPWTFGPSSNHPGVVNHGMADGSAKCVSEDIDPTLYMHLITRAGGEPVNEFHDE